MNDLTSSALALTRRHFLQGSAVGVGAAALADLLHGDLPAAESKQGNQPGVSGFPNFPGKAKRVIYLFQSGAPSQLDLFDYKPKLAGLRATDLPDSIRRGQRLTGMTKDQESFPVAPTRFKFAQHGRSGAWSSDLLPHTAEIADDLCFIKSLHTEAINHDPAITFIQTGAQLAGRPSMGAWLSYGLGSENRDLPAFVAMVSGSGGQPLYDRLWGSGFLPTRYQGVKFRSLGDPVLFLSNPPGISSPVRRRFLDDLARLNELNYQQVGDPEIVTRVAQYELAYRMQTSVPDLTDISKEPEHVFDLYGQDARKPGTFAFNCLLARRLAERGVRFVQIYHGAGSKWDSHSKMESGHARQCRQSDLPTAGLLKDLKARGLLDDTLVVWGGEFGRTPMSEKGDGRDHNPTGFTMWMAGGGVKGGQVIGATDELGLWATQDRLHVHDLHATILHLMGINNLDLIYRYKGRPETPTINEGQAYRKITTG